MFMIWSCVRIKGEISLEWNWFKALLCHPRNFSTTILRFLCCSSSLCVRRCVHLWRYITKTRLFKYMEHFTSKNTENFQIKNSDLFSYFHISAQNIDCGYSLEPPQQGGSNEYQQSMFLSRNKKNNVCPCKPQFFYIKVGFKGVKII